MKKILLCLLVVSTPACAEDYASPWSPALKSKARLLSAGESAPGVLLAGLEIQLAPNTLTYWRNPGEAGIPPKFSFEGSQNLKAAKVLFPAPSQLSEGGVLAYGYTQSVIFPIEITPLDAAKPVVLSYQLDYAACEKICIPAHGDGNLQLDKPSTPLSAQVQASRALVPVEQAVKAEGTPAILELTRLTGEKPGFDVMARGSAALQLFPENLDNLYVSVVAGAGGENRHFTLTLEDVPPDMSKTSLRLTLVDGAKAIETLVDVALKP